MTAHVLLNPAARGGRNAALRPALGAALADAGIDATIHTTAAPGDAEPLARALGEAGEVVIVAGGDGTIHEAVNGLVGTDGVLGVLAMGTGNDFAHALGMVDPLADAARQLAEAPRVAVDLGRVRWTDSAGTHERLFSNCLGAGFDAHVAALAAETKWLGGRAAYLAAVLRTLWAWRRPLHHVRTRVLAGAHEDDPLGHDGPLFLCSVGNGHSVGGGFHLTPDAVPHDGLLDVCLVRHLPTRRALKLLPTTFTGDHVGEAEVAMARLAGFGLDVATGALAVHADGEILTLGATQMEVEVLPGAITALAPGLG